MEDRIKLSILTPDKEVFNGEIKLLASESQYGKFEILTNHVAMISSLIPTVTSIRTVEGKLLRIFTSSGVLKVNENAIQLLCEEAEWPEDINLDEVEEEKRKAEEALESKDENDKQSGKLELSKALARIKTKNGDTK